MIHNSTNYIQQPAVGQPKEEQTPVKQQKNSSLGRKFTHTLKNTLTAGLKNAVEAFNNIKTSDAGASLKSHILKLVLGREKTVGIKIGDQNFTVEKPDVNTAKKTNESLINDFINNNQKDIGKHDNRFRQLTKAFLSKHPDASETDLKNALNSNLERVAPHRKAPSPAAATQTTIVEIGKTTTAEKKPVNQNSEEKMQVTAKKTSALSDKIPTKLRSDDVLKRTIIQIEKDLSKGDDVSRHKVKNPAIGVQTYGYVINKGDVYIRINKLGEGGFKKVSNTLHLNESRFVATAAIKDSKQAQGAVKEAKKEDTILDELHAGHVPHIPSKHIVSVITTTKPTVQHVNIPFTNRTRQAKTSFPKVNVIMDKYDADGDKIMQTAGKSRNPLATLSNKVFVLTNLAESLAGMHKIGLVHHDVKGANVLVKIEKGKVVKSDISDFGLTVKNGYTEPCGGTAGFLPAEYYEHDYVARPTTDSYALGATILEYLSEYARGGINLNSFHPSQAQSLIASKLLDNPTYDGHPNAESIGALAEVAYALMDTNLEERMSCEEAAMLLRTIQNEIV